MSFQLHALVGDQAALERHIPGLVKAHVVPLPQWYGLVPITAALVEEATGRRADEFPAVYLGIDLDLRSGARFRLPDRLRILAEKISRDAPLAFLHIECVAGPCDQIAVVWEDGRIVFGPVVTGDPWPNPNVDGLRRLYHEDRAAWLSTVQRKMNQVASNRALRRIGVERGVEVDEFDALGLGGRHRWTEDWVEEDLGLPPGS